MIVMKFMRESTLLGIDNFLGNCYSKDADYFISPDFCVSKWDLIDLNDANVRIYLTEATIGEPMEDRVFRLRCL